MLCLIKCKHFNLQMGGNPQCLSKLTKLNGVLRFSRYDKLTFRFVLIM